MGLMIELYRRIGFKIEDPIKSYSENWARNNENHFLENYHLYWKRIKRPEMFGDTALMNYHSPVPDHIGMFVEPNKVIHSARNAGVIISSKSRIEHLTHSYYRFSKANQAKDWRGLMFSTPKPTLAVKIDIGALAGV